LVGAIPCHADALDAGSGGWTCDYFIAWRDDLLTDSPPTFVAVRTVADGSGNYEMAIIEKTFLETVTGTPVTTLPTVADPR
jgi:hypothetical protein